MTIWELRFTDGRGASFYTTVDITPHIGNANHVFRVPVAASAIRGTGLSDAKRCFETGATQELVADVAALAFALQHTV